MTTSPTFTERRLYRKAAVLQAFQDALGTPVDDFTGAKTRVIWSDLALFDPQIVKGDFQGTTGSSKKRKEGRFFQEQRPVVRLHGGATPKTIEWILRSLCGPWSGGSPMSLTFSEGINEYATLALVENVTIPNSQKFERFWDGWCHRAVFRLTPGLSTLRVQADFACRDFERDNLNAIAPPIVLPANFKPPAIALFAPHSARLFRDPAGANVSIAVRDLEFTIESGLSHEPWNDKAPQVIKEGYTRIAVVVRSAWMDETYAMQLDSETVDTVFKRFKLTFASGASQLTLDLKNVDFKPSATGWQEGRFREIALEGEAYMDGSDNYLDVTMIP